MERISEIPSRFNTWLGPGDTIPVGKPPKALTDKFPANHFILSDPMCLASEIADSRNNPGAVSVLSIIPIYQEELEYKLRNSGNALLSKMATAAITDEVDIYRRSACRKRFLGF